MHSDVFFFDPLLVQKLNPNTPIKLWTHFLYNYIFTVFVTFFVYLYFKSFCHIFCIFTFLKFLSLFFHIIWFFMSHFLAHFLMFYVTFFNTFCTFTVSIGQTCLGWVVPSTGTIWLDFIRLGRAFTRTEFWCKAPNSVQMLNLHRKSVQMEENKYSKGGPLEN